jgi:hypothetical protein
VVGILDGTPLSRAVRIAEIDIDVGRHGRVTFKRPFALEALEGVHRSGTQGVATHEECAGLISFPNAKRTSTWLRISQNPGIGGVLLAHAFDGVAQPRDCGKEHS